MTIKHVQGNIPLRRSGGSSIVSLPKAALELLGMDVGDSFKVIVEDNRLVLEPAGASSAKAELTQMLKGFSRKDFEPSQDEIDWDQTRVGKEEL